MAENGEEASAPTITEKQVEIIEETWVLVTGEAQKKQQNLQAAGLVLFYKLFEIAPELQELFPFQGEELSDDNKKLRGHALQVMETIDVAIGMLHDLPKLTDTLEDLGIVHNLKNVQVASFAPVGQALIYTLGQGLKERFTDEVKAAWVALYTIVQHYMELGMKEGLSL